MGPSSSSWIGSHIGCDMGDEVVSKLGDEPGSANLRRRSPAAEASKRGRGRHYGSFRATRQGRWMRRGGGEVAQGAAAASGGDGGGRLCERERRGRDDEGQKGECGIVCLLYVSPSIYVMLM